MPVIIISNMYIHFRFLPYSLQLLTGIIIIKGEGMEYMETLVEKFEDMLQ